MVASSKKALICGITGQDGSYLAEYLLELGYQVHGMYRRSSTNTTERIAHLLDCSDFTLHYGDLSDSQSLHSLIGLIQPDEVYNLAAQSHVGTSFKVPEQTGDITGLGVTRLLEAILQRRKTCKFYQASTSELFGNGQPPFNEESPFDPQSPYGLAKQYAHGMVKLYREAHGLFACSGILFNHESPRRGDNFVTQKIAKQMVEIFKRERKFMELGNLDAKRDWGYAGDYVKAMHLMLQADEPEDYVIGTGEAHSVREFVELAAEFLGMEIEWEGTGVDEIGIDKKSGEVIVQINPEFFRPAEVNELVADATKAYNHLGWATPCTFKKLVELMVDHHLTFTY